MTFAPAPRLKGFDYVGPYRYSLTICTHERHPYFETPDAVDCVHAQLVRTAAAGAAGIIAYCYMPDHLHLLVQGGCEDFDLRLWMHLFKQSSGYAWKRRVGTVLWQRSYFDRVLRKDEASAVVARYLLMNPVRARLCVTPREYPFLGSLTVDVASLIEAAQST